MESHSGSFVSGREEDACVSQLLLSASDERGAFTAEKEETV